jgi:YVTN family beta-propeller protein
MKKRYEGVKSVWIQLVKLISLFLIVFFLSNAPKTYGNQPTSYPKPTQEQLDRYIQLTHLPPPATQMGNTSPGNHLDIVSPNPENPAIILGGVGIDLDIAYIQRTPAYNYDEDQKIPDPNELVTFVAHIANRGTDSSGSFSYEWRIDGQVVQNDTHSGLGASETDTLTLDWNWEVGDHEIALMLDPTNQILEITETNNSNVKQTTAIMWGVWVEQSFYDFFNDNVIAAGWGGNSFDDWIQRHATIWNDMFLASGAIDRVTVEKIIVVPDGDLFCSSNRPAVDASVDLIWGFMSEMVGVPSPANCGWTARYRDDTATWDRDMALIHELNHARYQIDLYGLNLFIHARPLAANITSTASSVELVDPPDFVEFTPPVYFAIEGELLYCQSRADNTFNNCQRGADATNLTSHDAGAVAYVATVRVQDGAGNTLLGSSALPVPNSSGDLLYMEPYFFEDIMDSGPGYGAYSAAVWNRVAGLRARCGNYNAPCTVGEFMDEKAPKNTLQLTWENGSPIANASVEIYYADPYAGVWYARQFDNTPDITLMSDDSGQVLLTKSPFSSTGDIVHTFGYSNAISLVKVTTQDSIGIQFVDITQFNLPYWQGEVHPVIPITFTHTIPLFSAGATFSATPQLASPISSSFGAGEGLAVSHGPSGTISFLDMDDGSSIYPAISNGDFPSWLIKENNNGLVIAANGGSDSVSIIDAETLQLKHTISVGDDPRSLAVDSSGQFLYVSNNGSKDISVINLANEQVEETIGTISNPEQIILSATSDSAYVVANSPGRLSLLDTHSNNVTGWFHIGNSPHAVAVSPDEQTLYVVDSLGSAFYKVDRATHQFLDLMAIPGRPHRLILSADGTKAYIANAQLSFLSVVDLATFKVTAHIEMQSPQWAMSFTQDGRLLVPLYDSGEVAYVDTATDTVLQKVTVGDGPTAVLHLTNISAIPPKYLYLPMIIK